MYEINCSVCGVDLVCRFLKTIERTSYECDVVCLESYALDVVEL
jgi:hypothetical protein